MFFFVQHLKQLYVDVAATKAEGVGYILCARTSTGEVLVLLWCLYEYENTGSAVVLVRNVLSFLVGDTKNTLFLGFGLLRLLGIFVGL